MRQVPQYLIIGRGRVARHFAQYLSLLEIPFQTWHRDEPLAKLHMCANEATHILLLINDSAIEDFIQVHLQHTTALKIHFSGSLVSEQAYGAHPLMSFTDTLYSLAQYHAIPFVIDDNAPAFSELLPGFDNMHVRLKPAQKAKYHALCVLGGNFSCLLWQKVFQSFEEELQLPKEIVFSYLQQQTNNLITNAATALTGPLVRGDSTTISANLEALADDAYREVYQSFVDCYAQLKKVAA